MYIFFYSLMSIVIALFFMMIGIVAAIIPWSDTIRNLLIQFLNENTIAISLFGLAFLLIGSALLAYNLQNTKRHYYYIRSGNDSISVDLGIIDQTLAAYWKNTFPKLDIPCHTYLKDNKIYITADLPYSAPDDQRKILKKIENEIGQLLERTLGYKDEFNLSISFSNNRPLA